MPSLASPPRWSLPDPHTASGCFETMRAYDGRLFRLEAHLKRLYASAQYLGLTIPMRPEALGTQLRKHLAASRLRNAVVRVALIPACAPDASLCFAKRRKASGASRPNTRRVVAPSIVVQTIKPPPASSYRRGIRVATVPTRRFPVSQIDPQTKFSARLGSVQAVTEAHLRRADEAVFMDGLGSVTESTASNLGVIKDGACVLPPCWLGLLAGITWQVLEEAAQTLNIPVHQHPLTRHDLYNADEVFLTSTIKEVLPVTDIDGRCIGSGRPGPYTKRLHRAFRQVVQRELRLHRIADGGR